MPIVNWNIAVINVGKVINKICDNVGRVLRINSLNKPGICPGALCSCSSVLNEPRCRQY